MKKLLWTLISLFAFSTCVMAADAPTEDTTTQTTTDSSTVRTTDDAATTDSNSDFRGLSTSEKVMIGVAVVGAAAIASDSGSSTTSHH